MSRRSLHSRLERIEANRAECEALAAESEALLHQLFEGWDTKSAEDQEELSAFLRETFGLDGGR